MDSKTFKTTIQPQEETPIKPLRQYGWVCPICGRVNAPWMSSCSCRIPAITYGRETWINSPVTTNSTPVPHSTTTWTSTF